MGAYNPPRLSEGFRLLIAHPDPNNIRGWLLSQSHNVTKISLCCVVSGINRQTIVKKQPHAILLSCNFQGVSEDEIFTTLSDITNFQIIPFVIVMSKNRNPNDFSVACKARDFGAYCYLDEKFMFQKNGLLEKLDHIHRKIEEKRG